MTREERELLVEAAAAAFRPHSPDGSIRPHKAWLDLDEAGRAEAFDVARLVRALEAALDAEGLSTTGRAVFDRIRNPR